MRTKIVSIAEFGVKFSSYRDDVVVETTQFCSKMLCDYEESERCREVYRIVGTYPVAKSNFMMQAGILGWRYLPDLDMVICPFHSRQDIERFVEKMNEGRSADEVVRKDYEDFWSQYPDQKNPADVNTKEKFDFAMSIGWRRFSAMQRASGRSFTRREEEIA